MRPYHLLLPLILLFNYGQAQTLHLLMVSDYANPAFGKVSLENETNIESVFNTVSSNLGYKLNKVYFNTGNKLFDRVAIVNSLNKLATNPEDIVVFYYNGFGFYPANNTGEYPTFQLNNTDNKTLSMDDVALQLSSKNNRLGLVIADIRNTQNNISDKNTQVPFAMEDLKKIISQKIFLEQTGVLKIVSAKKGMPSYPYFTADFKETFFSTSEISDSEKIKNISFGDWFSMTQSIINADIYYSEIKKPQEILWSFTKLNKKVKNYQPPVLNIPTPEELKAQLELLINPTDLTQRAKIERDTRVFFTPNATIELIKPRADSVQINTFLKINIDQYIKQTAGYDAKVKRVIQEFKAFEFRRTPDFKKFYELRIVEKIAEK